MSTPSGNFGNLTAGPDGQASRAWPIERFVAATNVNGVVPAYLGDRHVRGHGTSKQTIASAMDVGNPSNFERMLVDVWRERRCHEAPIWLAAAHADDEVSATIRRVYQQQGYLLDPHSAIAYLGLTRTAGFDFRATPGIFLATAHPAKFHEVVEAIIGGPIDKPAPLAEALSRPRHIMRIEASLDALKERLFE